MANATKTVLFEGLVDDGEYRVTLSKNARTELHLEKKGQDVLGQPCWQQIVRSRTDNAYLYVMMTALASLLTKDA